MHPFAMETAAILVHSLNRFSLCTKMAAVAVVKLLLCCDIIRKRSIAAHNSKITQRTGPRPPEGSQYIYTVKAKPR